MSWKVTAACFLTNWDNVCRSAKWVVDFGMKHSDLDGITAIGVDELMIPPTHPLPAHPDYEEMKAISLEELRGILASGGPDQTAAAKELLQRRDQKAILRLVYSLKQGDVAAEGRLTPIPSKSLAAIPYPSEDVAHSFAPEAALGKVSKHFPPV